MISIIIPTYNEADNLKPLIDQISLSLNKLSYEIIVIDDDSPDRTWELAQKLASKNQSIKVFRRLNERGLTSALNLGITKAQGAIIGWLDADLSHPPQLLDKMLFQLKTHDAVIASRYLKGAKDDRGLLIAVLSSRIINLLAQWLLFKDITDYTSGYILVKKKYLNQPLVGDYGEYFIDTIFNLKKQHARIMEIPYISLNRLYGQSKTADNFLGFIKRGGKYIIVIFRLWLKKSQYLPL